ncbi:MAG TPA: 4Fe-4S dicluster domain-containing protein [Methylocystis sp.]|nr:4Fe-4S dicluster domain-containing protein [Methylocystis sp.]
MDIGEEAVLTREGLQALLDALRRRGRRVIGPKLEDQAIVYDDIVSVSDLPEGWSDEQDGGRYRLVRREDRALFSYAVGPHSWKKFLHAPMLRLWSMERDGERMRVVEEPADETGALAFIGVRSCELHAIAIQDKVMLGGPYVDSHYRKRREGLFVVALNCGHAGGTCFCVSMGTGPEAKSGFDLSLTEILGESGHIFLARAGSPEGAEVLAELPRRAPTPDEVAAGEKVVAAAAAAMGREMRADDVHELLLNNLEHPRWDNVAERCLTCANCTMVCPTCFCTAVEDTSSLDGSRAERSRRWDSCFTMDFSYLHGGGVRASAKSRYRQWMTHKLATWIDQFGSSGCVGCGRCITWCPVGIDITEEVRAIRDSQSQ